MTRLIDIVEQLAPNKNIGIQSAKMAVTKCAGCGGQLNGDDFLERSGKIYCPDCADALDQKNKKLLAGGPGSGRKPSWQRDSPRVPVLDNFHSDLKKKGFKYKSSHQSGTNKSEMIHQYESDKKTNGGGQATITENKNGNHKAVHDSALSNFPVKLAGRL